MAKSDKPLPTLPAFKPLQKEVITSDMKRSSVPDLDAFVYCSDYGKENYEQYKQTYKRKTDYKYGNINDEHDVEFQRKDVKDAIHIITMEIKAKGAKSPFFLLPFRPQQHDIKLKNFLNNIFINGKIASNERIEDVVKETDEYTLASALKFFWCRLPGNCVVGWSTYTKFSTLEEESNFPESAFLDYMPSCLSSGAHASIVYDFFDLLVAIAMNSKENLLNGKKISKMCGLWAFHANRTKQSGLPSFERGMYEWIPSADAMFHLLLAFLRAMPPKGKSNKLPKVLQSFLKSTSYPPPSSTISGAKYLQEVPMVTLRANHPSKSPAELLARVGKTLHFEDPTVFYTREDYLLLKRLFKDVTGLIPKLSSEGSRLLDSMCMYDDDMISDGVSGKNQLKFKLISGWSSDMVADRDAKKRPGDFFSASVSRASIDDYFIWTWLASLGSEETSVKKKTFGKTYILEVELAEGFKKWVIIEEQDITKDGYDIEIEIKQEKLRELEERISAAELEASKLQRAVSARVISESKGKKYQPESPINEVDLSDQSNETELVERMKNIELPTPPLPSKDYYKPQPTAPSTVNNMNNNNSQINNNGGSYTSPKRPNNPTFSPQPLPKDTSYQANAALHQNSYQPQPQQVHNNSNNYNNTVPYYNNTNDGMKGSKAQSPSPVRSSNPQLDPNSKKNSYTSVESYQTAYSTTPSPQRGRPPLANSNNSNVQYTNNGSYYTSPDRQQQYGQQPQYSSQPQYKSPSQNQHQLTPVNEDTSPKLTPVVSPTPQGKLEENATQLLRKQPPSIGGDAANTTNKRTSKILESFDDLEEQLLGYLDQDTTDDGTEVGTPSGNKVQQREASSEVTPTNAGPDPVRSTEKVKPLNMQQFSTPQSNATPRMLHPDNIPQMSSPSPQQDFYQVRPTRNSPSPGFKNVRPDQLSPSQGRGSPHGLYPPPQGPYPVQRAPPQQQQLSPQNHQQQPPQQQMANQSPRSNRGAFPPGGTSPNPGQRGRTQGPPQGWSPGAPYVARPGSRSPARSSYSSNSYGGSSHTSGYPPYAGQPIYGGYQQGPPPPGVYQGGQAPPVQPYYAGYPPQNAPYGYPPQAQPPYGYPPQAHHTISDLAINQMPVGGKANKLHGHSAGPNKSKARNALMNGDFGI